MNPTTFELTTPALEADSSDPGANPITEQTAPAISGAAPISASESIDVTREASAEGGATSSGERGRSGLLINRSFALLWSGQALSIVGDMVFNTTLVVWIATQLARGQSWAPLAVGAVLFAAAVPAFLIGPFAGVFVDRLDKRRMMLRMDGLRAIIVAALILATGVLPLPFLAGAHLPLAWTLGAIYAVVFLVNSAEQFFRPAMMALIGDIVPEAEQPKALGLGQASVSLAAIIGPALAAPLFIAFGAQWALLINALSFVVSYATVAAIRAPRAASSLAPGARPNFARELGEGLRFFAHSRVLVTLLVGVIVAVLGTGALDTLSVFFTTGNLHAPVSLYGFMSAVFGVGAIVGAILASVFAQRLGVGRTLWAGLLLSGVSVVVVARMTSVGPGLVLFALIGFFIAVVNVAVGPLMLRATPRELMGRVNSVLNPALNASLLLSTALAGYLDGVTLRNLHISIGGTTFGPVDTIFTIAGLLIILSAFVVMVGLRGVDKRVAAQ